MCSEQLGFSQEGRATLDHIIVNLFWFHLSSQPVRQMGLPGFNLAPSYSLKENFCTFPLLIRVSPPPVLFIYSLSS